MNWFTALSRRAVQSILLVLLLIGVNFFLIHLAPGDPVTYLAGQSGDEAYYNLIRAKFGLDQPLPTQLWLYISSVLQGDLGYSLSHQQPVGSVIVARVPATLLLVLSSTIIASLAGVWLGVETAHREDSFYDRIVNAISLAGHSIPSFSIGLVLLLIFSLYLGLFPAQGMTSAGRTLSGPAYLVDLLTHLALPVVTLAFVQIAQVLRITRAQMISVLRENFITTARAKGVGENKVLYGHALRNAMLPIVTIIGSDIGVLLSGAVLVETVFAYPGLGRLMIDAVAARDYPMLLGILLMISVSVAVVNFLVDMIYPVIDPRIEYS